MKIARRLALLLVAFSLLVGCSSGTTTDSTSTDSTSASSSTSTSTSSGEEFVLKMSLSEELNSLDPSVNFSATSTNMILLVNEGLMKFTQDTKEIEAGLAESYTVSDDGLTYTFTIRETNWSNGTPLTAYDFEYSFKRLADPEMGCMYAYMLMTAGIVNSGAVTSGELPVDDLGVYAVDDRTLVIELDSPKSYFLELLCSGSYFMPINQEFCEECGDMFMRDVEHTISVGVFDVESWDVGGSTITLVKNETYYNADNIELDGIDYALYSDDQQSILAWEQGDLDACGLTGDFVSLYTEDEALTLHGQSCVFFLSFNTEDEYLSNQNLRLAISMAFDKEAIANNIMADGSMAADYIIPADFAATTSGEFYRDYAGNPTYNSFDVTTAQEYFELAKAELGVDTIELNFLYDDSATTLSSISAYIQDQLQTNLPGLTINLNVTTYNQRLTDMSNGDYDIGMTRWHADYQDASTYLDMWISNSGLNYGSWSSAEYDAMYEQVIGEYAMMEEERLATQIAMEELILSEAAICPVYQSAVAVLYNADYNWYQAANSWMLYQFTDIK